MATTKEQLAQEVAKAVGAGKVVALETVDFNDPNRPKTCLEVDFPILPVNQVAIIEGNAGKPIYQMSKWWARRRSSVFRSILLAAAIKAPENKSYAAKLVWDNYYANHQKKSAFKKLKIADIFMGGGTTMVEGSRLGMQMVGNDLNPVAWFIVKQELAKVDLDEVNRLLVDIEAEVKPQIMPYYYCDGPNGEKGKWIHLPTKRVMTAGFDPLSLTREQRSDYGYEGPEIIYTYWGKHGPCQVTGCGHRTPIMASPVIAVKALTVKYWEYSCSKCGCEFHVEEEAARMAPDVPLFVAPSEHTFSVLDRKNGVICPHCGRAALVNLGKGKTKKVELSLLVHPQWLAGSPNRSAGGQLFGGSAQDDADSTARWNEERASKIRLLEVRGELPEEVTCPDTKVTFKPEKGTVPKKSNYTCSACGTVQDVLATIRTTGKTGPMAAYAIQAYSPQRNSAGLPYSGRFFASFGVEQARQYNNAATEWETRRHTDLAGYWPTSEVPFGFMTHLNNGGIPNHGYTHWWTMFNAKQLLVVTQILKAIIESGTYDWAVREYVLGVFQNYVRYQNSFCFWHVGKDHIVPHMSNNNFHPKTTIVENSVFPPTGMGNWYSCTAPLFEAAEWKRNPWDTVSLANLEKTHPALAKQIAAKGTKAFPGDPVLEANIFCASSTELESQQTASVDLVITDPPFGGLLHYSELADFFYVWLRLALKDRYPQYFGSPFTPKSLEAVANRAREPEDPDGFYQRLLTQCWKEANRILKAGGILAFTFHHSEDEPWVAVLESLFDAGFYLEATYPIRSDETKGEGGKPGTFGSQTIEYDIIHVCRKRTEEPQAVSWGRMRREVMADVRQLQAMLENHAKQGLPAADLQVIRRGKALEYFSRHYGKVYVDEGRAITVKDALVGINQLIDEDSDRGKEATPVTAEPMTRQFLRTFDGKAELARDQLQKFLKGSITTPDEFVQRGWCLEKNKIFTLVDPLNFARDWHGKHKRKLASDLDQALVLIGACFDGSGINAADTLKNDNFKPHAALKALLEWLGRRGVQPATRNAASRALSIYNNWADSHQQQVQQMALFFEES
jgi:putative DNA methylase